MAIELNLDTVDQLAQDNYSDIVIPLPGGTAATLLHPLRLSDEKRDELQDYFKDIRPEEAEEVEGEDAEETEAEKVDMLEQLQGLLRIIASGDADELFAAVGTDLTKYQAIVTFYFETVNPGEA